MKTRLTQRPIPHGPMAVLLQSRNFRDYVIKRFEMDIASVDRFSHGSVTSFIWTRKQVGLTLFGACIIFSLAQFIKQNSRAGTADRVLKFKRP
jgi:hypothetical protein